MDERHYGYDNCKNLFIFYVVLWHMLNNWYLDESVKYWSPQWAAFFKAYALWHEKLAVPGFSFLSGYFGKKYLYFDRSNASRWKRTLSTFLVGPLFIQLFEICIRFILKGMYEKKWETSTSFLFWDHLETWYLLALLIWRLSTPALYLLKRPLLTSLLFALLHVHMSYGYPSELQMRLFRFFPYYVAGIITDESTLKRIPRPTLLGTIGVISTLYACYNSHEKYLGITYSDMSWNLESHFIFFLQYFFCGVIFLSLILLVRQIPFPLFPFSHGSSTLAVYIWHWQVMNPLLFGTYPFSGIQFTEIQPLMRFLQESNPAIGILTVHLICYCICSILGSRLTWRVLKYISTPDCTCLFNNIDTKEERMTAKNDEKLKWELLIPKMV